MKHYYNIITTIFLFAGLLSCACNNEVYFLSEPYVYVRDVYSVEKQAARIITEGENYNACEMLVEDSLCILYTPSRHDFFFAIFDINTGNHIGEFCRRGNGPFESTNMCPITETYRENGHLIADVLDVDKERIIKWDITASIKDGNTVYSDMRKWNWRDEIGAPLDFYSKINDIEFFMVSIIEPFGDIKKVITPRFEVRSANDCKLLNKYQVFRDSVAEYGGLGEWGEYSPFICKFSMNPSKTKLAMGMGNYPQINILDIYTGNLRCFRVQGTPNVNVSKNINYYSSICCDNQYIYALYQNKDNALAYYSNGTKGLNPCQIHIFDWNGHLVSKWQLDTFYHDISIYANKLYTIRYDSGIIAEYDI